MNEIQHSENPDLFCWMEATIFMNLEILCTVFNGIMFSQMQGKVYRFQIKITLV